MEKINGTLRKISKTPKKPRKTSLKLQINSPLKSMSDMNNDCLIHVFDHLDIGSLLKMCKLSKRFSELITERVIPLKTINFSDTRESCSTLKIFQKFGPWMTRIVVDCKDMQIIPPKTSPIGSLVRLITAHCTPGKLQCLSLTGFGAFDRSEMALVNAAKPWFANVHTLCIDVLGSYHSLYLVNNIFSKENLHRLSLHNVRYIDEWLTVASLPHLQDLHICMQTDPYMVFQSRNLERMRAYIRSKPTLTRFDYYGPNHEEILLDISVNIPGLTHLGTIRARHASIDDNNNNNQVQSERKKWKYLNEFAGLKEISLQSSARNFANCGEIFRILASRNTLEKLELLSVVHPSENSSAPVEEKDLRQLTKVKSLQLNNFGKSHSDEFLTQLFQSLPGLVDVTISGKCLKQSPIITLLQHAHGLRVLRFENKATKTISARFYKNLVKVRKAVYLDKKMEPLIIKMSGDMVSDCISELGNRSYKPNIIMLKHI